MKNFASQVGIQSYCFRGFKSLAEVLPRLKACGVATVELCGVHGDFVFDRAGRQSDVVIREGNLDLPKLCALLEANDRTASVVIEYEGDIENPVPSLTQCVRKITAK